MCSRVRNRLTTGYGKDGLLKDAIKGHGVEGVHWMCEGGDGIVNRFKCLTFPDHCAQCALSVVEPFVTGCLQKRNQPNPKMQVWMIKSTEQTQSYRQEKTEKKFVTPSHTKIVEIHREITWLIGI